MQLYSNWRKCLLYLIFLVIGCLSVKTSINAGSYPMEIQKEKTKKGLIPNLCLYAGLREYEEPKKIMKKIYAKYGESWMHMHHYCWALLDIQNKRYSEALGNIDYVLRNSKKNFPLRDLLYYQKGQIYELMQKDFKAAQLYIEAIKFNNKYEPAYFKVSNIYTRNNMNDLAYKILSQGVKINPKSKLLKIELEKNVTYQNMKKRNN